MQQNLDYYKWLYPEVERRLRKKELKNLELKLFNNNFRTGWFSTLLVDVKNFSSIAYLKKDYKKCAEEMEEAMKGYFTAMEDCQALCYEMPSYQV